MTIPPSGNLSSGVISGGHALRVFEKYVSKESVHILDIGCGNGEFLFQLQKRGYRNIFGIEANNYGVKEFDIQLCNVSYEKLPYADGSFDVVTAWEVFEHLENPYFCIREIYRILKPGGLFLLSMPNLFHLESRLMFFKKGEFRRWNESNDHKTVFSHALFKKAFLRYFTLVEARFPRAILGKEGFLGAVHWKMPRIDRMLPENEWFGAFAVYVLRR